MLFTIQKGSLRQNKLRTTSLDEIKFALTRAYGVANDINDDTSDADIGHPVHRLLG